MRSFSLYIAQDSPVHRLDARAKVVLLLVFSIGIFFVDSWWGMLAASAIVFAVFALSKLPAKAVFAGVIPVYVLCAFTLAFNAFTWQEGAGIAFTLEGLVRGCFFAIRICLLVWASMIVCFSTTSTQLVDAFVWFLQPLRRLHVPVDDIAMMFSIALRFIPLIMQEYGQIKDAQWSRGARFDEGGLIARIRAHGAILLPLIVSLFRRADRLAQAMDARCYGLKDDRR